MKRSHVDEVMAEDIINRGGATLALELFESDQNDDIDTAADVTVVCDGVKRVQPAGAELALSPGESVTLLPGNWHAL